ncbi:MAG TPA: hypothetical protein VJS66_04955 [Burkholderiales bacterium]|nr:hypothetical protein [Burkholderiales bacterium]
MRFGIYRGLLTAVFVVSALFAVSAGAKENLKEMVKTGCASAGGSYSSGDNYGRCEYSNGDSYTCNTDVNKCEACTKGKCTVSMRAPGASGVPGGPTNLAPASNSPQPGKGAMPAGKSAPAKKTP